VTLETDLTLTLRETAPWFLSTEGGAVCFTVGQVAALSGVTVRTLHHYDEIGLLRPSGRTGGGYRQYDEADLARLHRVLSYRELGFPLDQVAGILDDPGADAASHLRGQHRLVRQRISRLERMLAHIEKAMEAEQMGISLTPQEQFEVFGPDFEGELYAAEAEQRWGDSDAWTQSRRRTAAYTKEDWVALTAESAGIEQGLAAALAAGVAAGDPRAMFLAEALRAHIERWFYDVSPAMHRGLGDMYVADSRFARHYEDAAPGLAQYLRDAIQANADRTGAGQ
jgi:DNA-binding transcriptional MerR regulator